MTAGVRASAKPAIYLRFLKATDSLHKMVGVSLISPKRALLVKTPLVRLDLRLSVVFRYLFQVLLATLVSMQHREPLHLPVSLRLGSPKRALLVRTPLVRLDLRLSVMSHPLFHILATLMSMQHQEALQLPVSPRLVLHYRQVPLYPLLTSPGVDYLVWILFTVLLQLMQKQYIGVEISSCCLRVQLGKPLSWN